MDYLFKNNSCIRLNYIFFLEIFYKLLFAKIQLIMNKQCIIFFSSRDLQLVLYLYVGYSMITVQMTIICKHS